MLRTPRTTAIARKTMRRKREGSRSPSDSAAAPTRSAAATAKHASGGGTSSAPTTASASRSLFANGKTNPPPHAAWSPAKASKTTDAARLTWLSSISRNIREVEYLGVSTVGASKDLHVPMLLTHLCELTKNQFRRRRTGACYQGQFSNVFGLSLTTQTFDNIDVTHPDQSFSKRDSAASTVVIRCTKLNNCKRGFWA
jgi:hypothetical protein